MPRSYPAGPPPREGSGLPGREGSGEVAPAAALAVAQRQAQVARRRLRAVGGVELAQDVLDVELHRALGDDERAGDVGVRLAADHVLEHVDLAASEQVAQRAVAAGGAGRLLAGRGVALDGEVDRAVGELARARVGPGGDLAQLLALDAQAAAQDGALEDGGER